MCFAPVACKISALKTDTGVQLSVSPGFLTKGDLRESPYLEGQGL